MKEIIGAILLVLVVGLIAYFFIVRPLVAIGDIPGEIRELRESIDFLTKTIKYKDETKKV